MQKANRAIAWASALTLLLVAPCLLLPRFVSAPDDGNGGGEILVAISLFAAYLILVGGIMVVGVGTYSNLALRRADAALETRRNRNYFAAGVAFCLFGLAFIFFPVL